MTYKERLEELYAIMIAKDWTAEEGLVRLLDILLIEESRRRQA